ncbi:MAG: acyltransferase family protein [Lachnospiraceae bacterium]|nr:acyltransferase family protein [Lachnospiraceae bacterium]
MYIKTIDYMKGMGIFLVVLAHTNFSSQFINLFHMAVFFIIAGYCYHDFYSEDVKAVSLFIKKRLKSLYIPYVFCNMILICLHNLFYKINIYTDNPSFVENDILHASYGAVSAYTTKDFIYHIILTLGFVDGEQLAGTIWFLRALFEVSILYVMIDYVSRKCNRYRTCFIFASSIFIITIGYFLNINNIHIITGIEQTCYYFIFFTIGVFLQRINIEKVLQFAHTHGIYVISVILSASVLIVNNYLFSHALVAEVNSPFFYVTNGMCGGYCLMAIAKILMKSHFTEFVAYMGRNSLHIMLWHFLSFKLVSYGYIMFHNMPAYYIASFPVLKVRYLWIIYTIVGIALPLVTAYILQMAMKFLKHRFEKSLKSSRFTIKLCAKHKFNE